MHDDDDSHFAKLPPPPPLPSASDAAAAFLAGIVSQQQIPESDPEASPLPMGPMRRDSALSMMSEGTEAAPMGSGGLGMGRLFVGQVGQAKGREGG